MTFREGIVRRGAAGYEELRRRLVRNSLLPARYPEVIVRAQTIDEAVAAVRTPGPLRAFGERVAARRGRQVAIVAVARKLTTIAWRLLTSGQDYAYANPGQVRLKWRRVELLAGEPSQKGRRTGISLESKRERELALAAERAYQRLVADWQAVGRKRAGTDPTVGRASNGLSPSPAARQTGRPQASALQLVVARTRRTTLAQEAAAVEST